MSPQTIKKFLDSFTYSDNCWEWNGYKKRLGYGEFYANNARYQAHRFSYELFKGAIPDGLVLDHLCRNTSCVNPSHLEAVSNIENVMRGEGVGARAARKTHCDFGHTLTGSNVWLRKRPNGRIWRKCRKCAVRIQTEYRNRKKLSA